MVGISQKIYVLLEIKVLQVVIQLYALVEKNSSAGPQTACLMKERRRPLFIQ